jgi:hypothetical protein
MGNRPIAPRPATSNSDFTPSDPVTVCVYNASVVVAPLPPGAPVPTEFIVTVDGAGQVALDSAGPAPVLTSPMPNEFTTSATTAPTPTSAYLACSSLCSFATTLGRPGVCFRERGSPVRRSSQVWLASPRRSSRTGGMNRTWSTGLVNWISRVAVALQSPTVTPPTRLSELSSEWVVLVPSSPPEWT